jgi:hypothetical protein
MAKGPDGLARVREAVKKALAPWPAAPLHLLLPLHLLNMQATEAK